MGAKEKIVGALAAIFLAKVGGSGVLLELGDF